MTKLTNAEMISFLMAQFDLSKNQAAEVIESLKENGDMTDEAYEVLFAYYCDKGEIPYGTATAKDGDPIQWVQDRIAAELGI